MKKKALTWLRTYAITPCCRQSNRNDLRRRESTRRFTFPEFIISRAMSSPPGNIITSLGDLECHATLTRLKTTRR